MHPTRWTIAIIAAAAAGLAPGIAQAQSTADDLLRRAANSPEINLMPDSDARTVRRSRAPIQQPGAPLGESVDPTAGSLRPGSTAPAGDTASGGQTKLRITCRKANRRFTCRVSRAGAKRVLLTCKGASRKKTTARCLKQAGRRLGPTGRAAALNWQGFPAQRMAAVGRLVIVYPNGFGRCSGTVVSRTLVLAAGHCFDPSDGMNPTGVVFLPGATWTSSDDQWDYSTPYGRWAASNWWAPGGWQSNEDGALDWGLVEIPPASNGQPISAYTGAWRIQPNIGFRNGAQIYSVGYPASGWWTTSEGGRTRGQYACSGTWDGDWARYGSGWELWTRCTMNRGASGGPWFVKLGDGSWVLGGVNNRCRSRFDTATGYCDPYSDWMRSSYIDSRFVEFWNSVQPLLRYR